MPNKRYKIHVYFKLYFYDLDHISIRYENITFCVLLNKK